MVDSHAAERALNDTLLTQQGTGRPRWQQKSRIQTCPIWYPLMVAARLTAGCRQDAHFLTKTAVFSAENK